MRSDARREFLGATSADVLTKLLGYVVLAILTRAYAPAEMGEFFFAMAFVSIFAMVADPGTGRYLVRRLAQAPGGALDELSEVLSLRLGAVGLGLVLLNGSALLLQPERAGLIALASVSVLVGDLYFVFGSFLVGLRKIGQRVLTGLISPILLVVLVLVAIRGGSALETVLLCYIVAAVVRVVASAVLVWVSIGPYRVDFDSAGLRRVLEGSFHFFLLGFLGVVLLKVDTLMILFFRTAEEVAQYESAYKFLEVSRFVVRSAAMVFFSRCAYLAALDRWDDLRRLVHRLFGLSVAGGAVFAAVVIAGAPFLIPLVWGDAYDAAIPVLRILFLGLPALYLSFVGTFVAQALGLERAAVVVLSVGILVNVILNTAAIPRLGAPGAAWASVVTELLLSACLALLVLSRMRALRRDAVPAEALR